MIYTSGVCLAMRIAYNAHQSQADKGGYAIPEVHLCEDRHPFNRLC